MDGGHLEHGGSWRPFWLVAIASVLGCVGAHPAATAEPGTVEP
jgi:hypothetical protein